MEKIEQSKNIKVFWILIIINIIMSIADIIFTYIGSPDLSIEGNPLVYVFGLSWKSLIILSIIFLVIIIALLYYSFFRFNRIRINCEGLRQYISILFYNRPDKIIWIFYKFPNNKSGLSYFFASLGCVLAVVIPIGKLFAVFLWIGIINNLNIVNYYHNNFNIIMTPLGRADILIGGIILAILILYHWFYREYKINKKILENIE